MSDKSPADLPRAFGAYSLLKLLARGGMGEIYLARTTGITGFEKYYAVKKLLKKFTHDNDVGARFIDEAKLGARLQHPNIVQVYDLGKVTEELYMATEFVDGFDLRRVLRFCHEKKKRIPLDIALFIVREILSGLAYAHRQMDAEGQLINLIHRDISPQNVLVSFEGEVKIIDFGLAKSTQRSQETQANVLLGNFGYMSPEQARGQVLDVRTDIYSAGIVLFELVTGTKRFVEENPLKLLEMVARPTPIMPSDRVPSVPKAIDKVFEKATSHDRAGRFESAEAFRDDITTALHRLNPRASRENLAQFLNHLFLGGVAPPSVDNDVLNKSVVLMAKDLHADAESMTATAVDDLKNRALSSDFDDKARQTDSHELLRSARVGDVLSHDAITGTPAPASAGDQDVDSDRDVDDVGTLDVVDDFDLVPEVDGVELDEHFDQALGRPPETSQMGPLGSMGALSIGGAAEGVVDESQRPTRVYDSPSWPQGEIVEPSEATEIRTDSSRTPSELEVQRQLEEQADAQAAVQRQLEAQMHQAELERQVRLQAEAQMQNQLEMAQQAQIRHEAQQRQEAAERAKAAEDAARSAKAAEQQARQLAMQAQMAEAQAMQEQVAAPRPRRIEPLGQATRTETMMPAVDLPLPGQPIPPAAQPAQAMPRRPSRSMKPVDDNPPSIVIAPDLEAEIIESDATTRNAPASGGFGEGGGHESLIIDFGGEPSSEESVPDLVADASAAPIRPAARPLGRPVVSAVTSSRPRRASDEGPPSTMPPPTRRR